MKLPFSLDPFLVILVAVVGGASLLPVRGQAAEWTGIAADLGIVLLFFLHGAKLSREAIMSGIAKLRLHGLVFGSTYVLFPLIGLAMGWALAGHIDALLLSGLLFLTLLPSTVQSSIAFTAIAGGDVAAAVCSASISNMLGIFITPLLVGLFMNLGGGGEVSTLEAAKSIAMQLLLPFVVGHLMRPLIGGFVARHKTLVQRVDRGSILLVVYSAFSAAVVNGLWTRVGALDLALLLLLSAVVLAIVMGVNVLVARLAGLAREDAIVLLFCGSKKSLASGVPMAGALFPAAQVGMIVLPLMIFHQLQLFVCAVLANRYKKAMEEAALPGGATDAVPVENAITLPRNEADIAARAAALDMVVPEACMPGLIANMTLLERHARTLLEPQADPAT